MLKKLSFDDPNEAITPGANTLERYVEVLRDYGAIHESLLPYDERSIQWDEEDHRLVQMIREAGGPVSLLMKVPFAKYRVRPEKIQFRKGRAARNVEHVRRLLDEGARGVVVAYSLYQPTWRGHLGSSILPMEPDGYEFFQGGIRYALDDLRAGGVDLTTVETRYADGVDRKKYGGHAVTIVGYDDRGFLFKNSWGADWADEGYGSVSYDYHRLLTLETLAILDVEFVKPAGAAASPGNPYSFRLKTNVAPDGSMTVSLFSMSMHADPHMSSVQYEMVRDHLTRPADSGKVVFQGMKLAPISGAYDNSFQVVVPAADSLYFDSAFQKVKAVVSLRLLNTTDPFELRFDDIGWKTAEYEPWMPKLKDPSELFGEKR